MSLTVDDLAAGFYRTKDLMAMKIISSRSDLKDKQDEAGFPRPLKPGARSRFSRRLKCIAGCWRWRLSVTRKSRTQKIRSPRPSLRRGAAPDVVFREGGAPRRLGNEVLGRAGAPVQRRIHPSQNNA